MSAFPDRDTVAAKIASLQEPDQAFLKLIFENPAQDDALLLRHCASRSPFPPPMRRLLRDLARERLARVRDSVVVA